MIKYIKPFFFRFTIKGLSKFKNINKPEGKNIATDKVKAFGIEWILNVSIQQENNSNENENYFGIYLGANQNPRIQ